MKTKVARTRISHVALTMGVGVGRAAARPFAVGGWLPVDGLPR